MFTIVDFTTDTVNHIVKIYHVTKERLENIASNTIGEEGVINVSTLVLNDDTELKYTLTCKKGDVSIDPFKAVIVEDGGVNNYWDRVVFTSIGRLTHAVPSNLYLSDYKMKQLVGSTLKDLYAK